MQLVCYTSNEELSVLILVFQGVERRDMVGKSYPDILLVEEPPADVYWGILVVGVHIER